MESVREELRCWVIGSCLGWYCTISLHLRNSRNWGGVEFEVYGGQVALSSWFIWVLNFEEASG